MAAIAKKSTPASPFIVGNELFCSMIARVALLPCPPGALLENEGETYFCSLDFNTAGAALPPIIPPNLVAAQPELSWGVLLFDVLVMNSDRHAMNISHNTATGAVTIFDHSHAFMTPAADVDQRLAQTAGHLAIGGHCLAGAITTWQGFDMWVARLRAIPDYYLEGAIDAACSAGLPPAKKAAIVTHMKQRRDHLPDIVTNNAGSFPNLPARPVVGGS